MFRNILIGVDGRQGGRDAIVLGGRLAAPGATLTLAHIYHAPLGVAAAEALPAERVGSQELLIVGSPAYGPVGRLFHGSVSRCLLGHVSCPLLVLPRGAHHGDDAALATSEPESGRADEFKSSTALPAGART